MWTWNPLRTLGGTIEHAAHIQSIVGFSRITTFFSNPASLHTFKRIETKISKRHLLYLVSYTTIDNIQGINTSKMLRSMYKKMCCVYGKGTLFSPKGRNLCNCRYHKQDYVRLHWVKYISHTMTNTTGHDLEPIENSKKCKTIDHSCGYQS